MQTFADLAQRIKSECTSYLGNRPNSGRGGRCEPKHKEPRRQSRNAARTKHAVPSALGPLCLEVCVSLCGPSFTCISTFLQQIPPLALVCKPGLVLLGKQSFLVISSYWFLLGGGGLRPAVRPVSVIQIHIFLLFQHPVTPPVL